MINKALLLQHLEKLLLLTKARHTNQGLVTYKFFLQKISNTSQQDEIEELWEKLTRHLTGIEKCGYFTDEEYQVVQTILTLESKCK